MNATVLKKRILSFVLSGAMVISMLPLTSVESFAEEFISNDYVLAEDVTDETVTEAIDTEKLQETAEDIIAESENIETGSEETTAGKEESETESVETVTDSLENEIDALVATSSNAVKKVSNENQTVVLKTTAEDGTVIVLSYNYGVFPEDASVSAKLVEETENDRLVEEKTENSNVSKHVTYDITVFSNGEEVQPDITKGTVNVSFILPETPSRTDAIEILHHAENELETVYKEEAPQTIQRENYVSEPKEEHDHEHALDQDPDSDHSEEECDICDCCDCCREENCMESVMENISDAAAEAVEEVFSTETVENLTVAETEVTSFSLYTVLFEYNSLSYSVNSGATIDLSTVLAELGITSPIVTASVPETAKNYLTVYQTSGVWKMESIQIFEGSINLYVKTTNAEYKTEITMSTPQKAVIRSYKRKATTALRVSELMEVYTTGFSDNASLSYKYTLSRTSGSGSVYVEFYNYADQFKAEKDRTQLTAVGSTSDLSGYAWFSVAKFGCDAYKNLKVSVVVTDTNTASATYNKTATASYSSFADPDLEQDLNYANMLLFVGETSGYTMKQMYGMSGITHITCDRASVTVTTLPTATVAEYSGDATTGVLKAVGEGITSIGATVNKSQCRHHYGQSKEATTKIYVIPMPVPTVNADCSVVLTNIKAGVTYEIEGVPAQTAGATDTQLVFYGVKPNQTELPLTVSAQPEGFAQPAVRVLSIDTTGAQHMHKWAYTNDSASTAKINAECVSSIGTHPSTVLNPQTLTISAPANLTYDGTAKAASIASTGGDSIGEFTLTSLSISYKTSSGTALTEAPVNAGTYIASVSVNGVEAYVEYTIDPITVTISGITADSKTYDGNTTASVHTDKCTISNVLTKDTGKVTVSSTGGNFDTKNVGTNKDVTVNGLKLEGDAAVNYVISSSQSNKVKASITQKSVNVKGTITGIDKTYDKELTASVDCTGLTVDGLITGDTVTSITATAKYTDNYNAGENKPVKVSAYTLSGGDSANYKVVIDAATPVDTTADINKKPIKVSGFKGIDKEYDGTNTAELDNSSLTIEGLVGTDTVTVTAAGQFSSVNVGTDIAVSITSWAIPGTDPNYQNYTVDPTSTATAEAADIWKREVKFSNVKAEDKEWDGSTAATPIIKDVTFDRKLADDKLTLTVKTAFTDANVGKNKDVNITVPELGGDSVGNYCLAATGNQETTKAEIKPCSTGIDVSVSIDCWTYGDTTTPDPVVKSTTHSTAAGDVDFYYQLEGTTTWTSEKPTEAGTYTLKAVFNKSQTHVVPQETTCSFTINKKKVTITGIKADSKQYDGTTDATLDTEKAAIEGVLDKDKTTLGFTVTGGTFDNKNVGTNKDVAFNGLALTGDAAKNYEIDAAKQVTSGKADITKKQVNVSGTISASDKTYDKTTAATVDCSKLSVVGLVGDEKVTSITAAAAFNDYNTGENKPVKVSAYTLSGGDSENYIVVITKDTPVDTSASITKKAVKVSGFKGIDRVYDGTNSASLDNSSLSFDGLISGDSLTVTATGHFNNKNVDTDKPVTIDTFSIDPASPSYQNYVIDTGSTKTAEPADITERTITYDKVGAQDKVYDGNTFATPVYTNVVFNNIIGGDVVVLTVTTSFVDANAGYKDVNITFVSLNGADAGNYYVDSANSQKTTKATISKSDNGAGTLDIKGWIYKEYDPEKNKPVVTSSTHDPGTVKYYYQKEGETTWSDKIPEDAGNYTVKAVFPENQNYNQFELTKTFVIHKKKVATPSVAKKYYNGKNQTADTQDTKDYVVSENKGGINAGDYNVKLTLKDPDNYTWIDDNSGPDTNLIFTILKAIVNELKKLKIDDWTYQDPDAPKKPEIESDFGQETVKYTYVGKDCEYGPSETPPWEAGTYYLIAYIPGTDNYPEIKEQREFTIHPKTVKEPVIDSKVYNGKNQTADVPTNPLYFVKENDGGINVGFYDVILELNDARNYKWEKVSTKDETLKFEITKRPDTVIEDLKIDDWTYEDDPNPPSGKTPYGDEIIYYYIGRNGTEYGPSTTPPEDAGDYYLVAEVKENENHGPAKEQKPFTINRKPIPVPEIDEKVYNGKHQYPYLINDPRFTVTINDGGTNVGAYDVVITPNKNYCWENKEPGAAIRPAEMKFNIIPDPQNEPGQQDKPHEYNSGEATIETSTNCDAAAPKTVVENLDLKLAYELLTPEEKTAYDAGDDVEIKIYMDVKGLKEEEVAKEEVAEISKQVSKLENGRVGLYFDLTLNKEITVSSTGVTTKSKIRNTQGNMVVITVTVPESLRRAGRTYYVVRVHEGVSETIYGPTECDEKGNITFETDLFSTYAVVVNDPVVTVESVNWWKDSDNGWTFRDANQKWYYISNHNLKYGWHTDPEDGYKYYLDPKTGIMATGWTQIGGKWYFFNEEPDMQTWFKGADGKWHYNSETRGHRPLGSMYRNEMTPYGNYVDSNGVYVEKKNVTNSWGDLDNGWYKEPGTEDWYYISDYSLKKGWHHDPEDGKWYYLDLNTGKMYTGWHTIEGKKYFFNPTGETNTWTQNELGRWVYLTKTKGIYRPYGSMYENEKTPDGSTVGADGAKL